MIIKSAARLNGIPSNDIGNVEKSRQPSLKLRLTSQRRSLASALPVEGRVLASWGCAGQTTDFFEHSLPLTIRGSSGAFISYWSKIFNSPMDRKPRGIFPGRTQGHLPSAHAVRNILDGGGGEGENPCVRSRPEIFTDIGRGKKGSALSMRLS